MSAGTVWPSEITEYQDPTTGALMRRLTGGEAHNHHLYFTATSYTRDGHLVIGSQRTGTPQLFLLRKPEGQLVQLTDEAGVSTLSGCVHPSEDVLYYVAGRQLKRLDLETFATEVLYEAPEGFRLSLPSITGDGSRLALAYSEALPLSTERGVIYSTMAEHYYRRPPSCVLTVETADGAAKVIWGEHAWISHVIISPVDRDCVVFCHEGGSWVKQRMWTVNASKLHQEAQPLMVQRPGEVAYHEYFLRDGQVGVQMKATGPDGKAEFYHCFMRPDGTWLRQYLLGGECAGHIQSNSDNSLRIGDRGHRFMGDTAGATMMSLYRFDGGRDRCSWLCEHGGDFSLQIGHPHPIFSPDNRYGLFTSNKGGVCQVYEVEIASVG